MEIYIVNRVKGGICPVVVVIIINSIVITWWEISQFLSLLALLQAVVEEP